MGEYATYNGQEVKIGTCEDMLYLRADQRHKVQRLSGSLDPAAERELSVIRFRFPWPDEDGVEPGAFRDHGRGLGVSLTFSQPMAHDHGSIQFAARCGLLLSIPCPLGPDARTDIKVQKNGWHGDVRLTQTAYRGGEWRVVCECGACGYAFNLPRWAAEELAVAIRRDADHKPNDARRLHEIADRVLAGYGPSPDAVTEATLRLKG